MTTQQATYQNQNPGCIGTVARSLAVGLLAVLALIVAVYSFRWITVDAPPIEDTPIAQIIEDIDHALAISDMIRIVGNEWLPDVDLEVIAINGNQVTITDPDGDQFICDKSGLLKLDASSCSTSPGEVMIDHDMGTALTQLDGAWIWHTTNVHTWISIGDTSSVYKCPNSIMSDTNAMMSGCIRVQDSTGPGGQTLGSVYSQ